MVTWVIVLAIGLAIGGAAGFYFGTLEGFGKKKQKQMQQQLSKTQQDLDEYRKNVTGHFLETAKLVNSMTESYQKVHEHLAMGVSELCNNEIEVNRMQITESKRLHQTPRGKTSAEQTQTADETSKRISEERVTKETVSAQNQDSTSSKKNKEAPESNKDNQSQTSERAVHETMAVAEDSNDMQPENNQSPPIPEADKPKVKDAKLKVATNRTVH